MTSLDTRKVRRLGKPRYPTDEFWLLQWLGSENIESLEKCVDYTITMFYSINMDIDFCSSGSHANEQEPPMKQSQEVRIRRSVEEIRTLLRDIDSTDPNLQVIVAALQDLCALMNARDTSIQPEDFRAVGDLALQSNQGEAIAKVAYAAALLAQGILNTTPMKNASSGHADSST